MDFRKILTLLRERGMDAELGTLNNGLPQISVRISGITFFAVPDHFPGYQKAESDFICLRTYLRMDTVDVHRKEQLDAAFNRISSNIRLVKIYSVENEGALYAFFEIQALTTPEAFVETLPRYGAEAIKAIQEVGSFVNSHPSFARSE